MYESTRNSKTVFGFAVTDTVAAWQVVQKYMNDKYYRPHEEFRDLYYTTAPGLGMQYLQFFKTNKEIQVVTFLGGPIHPIPLSGLPSRTADSVRVALKGMLEPLRQMELAEASAAVAEPAAPAEPTPVPAVEPETPAEPAPAPVEEPAPAAEPEVPVEPAPAPVEEPAPAEEPAEPEMPAAAEASEEPASEEPAAPAPEQPQTNVQAPLPTEIPTTADGGFVSGEAPKTQPTATQAEFGYGGSSSSQPWPQDPVGTRYPYDPVNGGPKDRASNAVAGLIFGIIGLLMAFLGMGMPVVGVFGLVPLTIALICSANGRRSRRRGIALAGLIISVIAVALVIFETLVWFEILRG